MPNRKRNNLLTDITSLIGSNQGTQERAKAASSIGALPFTKGRLNCLADAAKRLEIGLDCDVARVRRASYRPTAAAEASIEGYDGWGVRTGDAPIAADRSFFLSDSGNSFASPSSKYVIADTVVA